MSFQNTSSDAFGHNPWAKFDATPKQGGPIMTPEPYAFDFDALTVDLRLLGSWDEGETAFDVIVAMLRGDAALPDGPYQDIRVAEPFANESIGEEERPLDERTYLVTGFEAECPFDYPLELLDEQGTFASIPMTDATFSEIRRLANEAISERLGRRGCWKAGSARIDASGAHVTIVRA